MNIYGKREQEVIIGHKCDTCGRDDLQWGNFVPITVSFDYGHFLDGETYHFCSENCVIIFLMDELKKGETNDD